MPFFSEHNSLSNFHMSTFDIEGLKFNCNEQFYQYSKALHFNDKVTVEKILKEQNPINQKKMGKKVSGYNEGARAQVCDDVMLKGLLEKFKQNVDLKAKLLGTHLLMLYEANEYDTYWGIGVPQRNKKCLDTSLHKGENKLGKLLVHVRNKMVEEQASHDMPA